VAKNSHRVVEGRVDYVCGACCFAVVAAGLTRIRYSWDWHVLLSIVLPTALVAIGASLKLIGPKGPASTKTWLVAGTFVPIVAVVGFLEANFLETFIVSGRVHRGSLYLLALGIGAIVTVPIGLLGHLLLRWLVSRRFA